MTTTLREAFEKGTEAFNAHDIDRFADVLADDVVFRAPGGMGREGKAFDGLHIDGDVALEEGTFTGPGGRHPVRRPPRRGGLHPGARLP
jgi:ketosteroid isomerase-like protein